MTMPRERDEPVRLTRIYTGGGDRGETSLGDGTRVSKVDCRIAAFGAVDELNSLLGVVLAADVPDELRAVLVRVQNELFDLGADLSVPFGVTDRLRITHERRGTTGDDGISGVDLTSPQLNSPQVRTLASCDTGNDWPRIR